MADQDSGPDSEGDSGAKSYPAPRAGTPRWVKVFGIVAVILVLGFLIFHLMGGGLGNHMPSRVAH
jgi:hypothetical protein